MCLLMGMLQNLPTVVATELITLVDSSCRHRLGQPSGCFYMLHAYSMSKCAKRKQVRVKRRLKAQAKGRVLRGLINSLSVPLKTFPRATGIPCPCTLLPLHTRFLWSFSACVVLWVPRPSILASPDRWRVTCDAQPSPRSLPGAQLVSPC